MTVLVNLLKEGLKITLILYILKWTTIGGPTSTPFLYINR